METNQKPLTTLKNYVNQAKTMKNHKTTLKNHGNQLKTMKNHETYLKNHGNQPKTTKNHETTLKHGHGTMKNQSGTIKTNLELDRVVMGGSGGFRRPTQQNRTAETNLNP